MAKQNLLQMLGLSGVKWTKNLIRMGVEGEEDGHLEGEERVTQPRGSSGTCYGVLEAGVEVRRGRGRKEGGRSRSIANNFG